jgi:hypothetical protein
MTIRAYRIDYSTMTVMGDGSIPGLDGRRIKTTNHPARWGSVGGSTSFSFDPPIMEPGGSIVEGGHKLSQVETSMLERAEAALVGVPYVVHSAWRQGWSESYWRRHIAEMMTAA